MLDPHSTVWYRNHKRLVKGHTLHNRITLTSFLFFIYCFKKYSITVREVVGLIALLTTSILVQQVVEVVRCWPGDGCPYCEEMSWMHRPVMYWHRSCTPQPQRLPSAISVHPVLLVVPAAINRQGFLPSPPSSVSSSPSEWKMTVSH